jgi:hypothetical protein
MQAEVYDGNDEMEEERENTKTSNKSFGTLCEVLSTPLYINSNPFERDCTSNYPI